MNHNSLTCIASVTGITSAVPLMGIQEVKAIIRNIIKNCLLLLGLPDIHSHQLRNTMITPI